MQKNSLRVLLCAVALCGSNALMSSQTLAVSLIGRQTSPTEWTYDLTYDPLDNYSIFQPSTTITLSGLSGVTGAFGPTSTDFPNAWICSLNLDWWAAVLDGGTRVQWTHVGPGTGNFGDPIHVFGFRIIAAGAENRTVTYMTDGFSHDGMDPALAAAYDRDVVGVVAGPVVAVAPVEGGSMPEPASFAIVTFGATAVGMVSRFRTRRSARQQATARSVA